MGEVLSGVSRAEVDTLIANAAPIAPYMQTANGPVTTGAGTATLLGATALYKYGSSGGKPLLRFDYVGQAYHASLKGLYSLASTPGAVTARLLVGATEWTLVIPNLVVGTPGQWWDADAEIVCMGLSGGVATVDVDSTISYQAVGGVVASVPVERDSAPKSVTLTSGAATFDLQRTFVNGANTMQIKTLKVEQVR